MQQQLHQNLGCSRNLRLFPFSQTDHRGRQPAADRHSKHAVGQPLQSNSQAGHGYRRLLDPDRSHVATDALDRHWRTLVVSRTDPVQTSACGNAKPALYHVQIPFDASKQHRANGMVYRKRSAKNQIWSLYPQVCLG